MSTQEYMGPAVSIAASENDQPVVSVGYDRCEQVSLDNRRCWRTKHVDWCCDFEGVNR